MVEIEFALIVETPHAQVRTLALAEHLPGHQVGMVFHLANNNLVALVHKGIAKSVGH